MTVDFEKGTKVVTKGTRSVKGGREGTVLKCVDRSQHRVYLVEFPGGKKSLIAGDLLMAR